MRIAIDGTHIGSQADLHRFLAGPLDFGPYYGHNLSALWDRLSRDVERPVEIVWEKPKPVVAAWVTKRSRRSHPYWSELPRKTSRTGRTRD
ncbi:barstar family protein [Streptomyces drozdowiczii]|uniref:barstar family protein n=1 Tax=Streptomyces drozdowiczii TaxID=202862 RepID=UPI00403CCEE8